MTVRNALEPMEQYFEDAWAVAKDEKLPPNAASQAVPGMCRQGLEAACIEKFRRTRIGRGEAHERVERQIEQATTLNMKAALALLDDADKASQVGDVIADRWGRDLAEAFRACNKRVHEGYFGGLTDLINTSKKLAVRIKW